MHQTSRPPGPWNILWQHPPKPWDRGHPPLTQNTHTPSGYTAEQARRWFWEMATRLHIPKGAIILSITPQESDPTPHHPA